MTLSRLLAFIAVLGLLAPAPAFAQDAPKPGSAEAKKQAKAHFRQGKAYLEAGAYDDAIRELEAAYQLFPIADMQFNLGQAYRMKGERKKALDAFKKAAESAPDAKWVEEARAAIAALTHDVEVEEAEAARKKKESEEAEAERQRKAQEQEQARKRAEQEAEAQKQRALAEQEAARRAAEEQKAQEARMLAEQEAARRAEAERKAQRQREAEEAGGTLRTVGGVVLVVGLACLAGGVLEGLNAMDAQNKVTDPTLTQWTSDLDTKVRDGNDANSAMTTLYVVGGVAVAAGTVLYLLGVHSRSAAMETAKAEPAVRLSLSPNVNFQGGGLVLVGRF
jgi:tetratricopeptide (TPR) repeat protein